MKYTQLIFTIAVCTALALPAYAQVGRTGEGISRQVTALKNMMENSANLLRNRITTVENDMTTVQNDLTAVQNTLTATQNALTAAQAQLNTLTTQENKRTNCNKISGNTSIHWPQHPEANAKGCVSHTKLGGEATPPPTPTGRACQGKTVVWSVGKYTCSRIARSSPDGIKLRFNYNTAPKPYCGNRTTYGMKGSATFKCENGTFKLDKSSSRSCEKSYRSMSMSECR